MSVLVVGDQGVGKTTLILELARVSGAAVEVVSPAFSELQTRFTASNVILPTKVIDITELEFRVNLQGITKSFKVNWIDAPGEVWRPNSPWIKTYPSEWQSLEENLKTARAIVIILAPHRERLQNSLLSQAGGITRQDPRFRTRQQWQLRFKEWLIFLYDNCRDTNLIVFCLNFADLFTPISSYSQELSQQIKDGWFKYKQWIIQKHFSEIIEFIDRFDSHRAIPCQLFITTYLNRPLLEAPWLYLGTYL
jgi:hypothetical protein